MWTDSIKSALLAFAMLFGMALHAQDTLRLTLPGAEQLFIENNLLLLAEQYNIDAAQAATIQAKLYNNPGIAVSGGVYNPELKKVPDISNRNGQYTIEVQQLILLAGKRNKQIKLAETGGQLAGERFNEVLRTLRYAVRSNFYQLYFLQQSYGTYDLQIASLETLSETYSALQSRGVVTLKDLVRIRSLLYSLKAGQTILQNEMNDVRAELQLLLQKNGTHLLPVLAPGEEQIPSVANLPLQGLIDTAYANRYDLRMAQTGRLWAEQNLALQKALAVPDLTIGGSFDKRSAHVENATFLHLAIDLPFFNRNQGNIKAAKAGIAQSKTLWQFQQSQVENEVQKAYGKALNAERMLSSIDPKFSGDFEKLLHSITENFQKRNISLLEFTDFYESYKESLLQLHHLQNQRMQAIEELHFAIGKIILNK
jgi:cobalt-zinc-cadmium efflux system outer membrane protein